MSLLNPNFAYRPTGNLTPHSWPMTPREAISPVAYAAAVEKPAPKAHGLLWRFFFKGLWS